MNETSFSIDSSEGPYNTGKKYENGNLGHRPGIKGGYFPVPALKLPASVIPRWSG